MPGRHIETSTEYRYDYQGQLKDNETGKNDFYFREYDPALGRWQIPDPYHQYASPYLAMGNAPTVLIDPSGGSSGGGNDNDINYMDHCWGGGGCGKGLLGGGGSAAGNTNEPDTHGSSGGGSSPGDDIPSMGYRGPGGGPGVNDEGMGGGISGLSGGGGTPTYSATGSYVKSNPQQASFASMSAGFHSRQRNEPVFTAQGPGGIPLPIVSPLVPPFTPSDIERGHEIFKDIYNEVQRIKPGVRDALALNFAMNVVYLQKMQKEIDGLMTRAAGAPGVQYALIAQANGYYNVYSFGLVLPTGKVWLNAGEVWKYGETTSSDRYDAAYLGREGVIFTPQFFGTQVMIKIEEKRKIYHHFFMNGSLPAGNKIFR